MSAEEYVYDDWNFGSGDRKHLARLAELEKARVWFQDWEDTLENQAAENANMEIFDIEADREMEQEFDSLSDDPELFQTN